MLISKRILFLSPDFFNYSNLIKLHLESGGNSVSLFSIRPTGWLSKASLYFTDEYYRRITLNHYSKLLNNLEENYDYILIIRADLIPTDYLRKLKDKYPLAKFIQYIWDDIDLVPKLPDTFKYFDRVLSYDLFDSRKFNLVFRPFFFVNRKEKSNNVKPVNTELFFVGSFHTDRVSVLEKVIDLNPGIKFNYHFYINPLTFLANRIPISKMHLFKFRKVKYHDMIRTIENSLSVLDIQHASQHGLTTRIYEALGAKSKIATTNRNIMEYDFYNENNILVIDRDNPVINKSWLELPYVEYDYELLIRYSISNWILDIFNT